MGIAGYRHERREAAEAAASKPQKPFNRTLPALATSAWGVFDRYLAGRDLDVSIARRNSWFPSESAGDATQRIVIPASSRQAGNVYWQARSLQGVKPRFQSPHGVRRGDALVIVWGDVGKSILVPTGVVVEGPMDALAAAGVPGCFGVALMGSTPPPEVIDHLVHLVYGCRTIIVTDSDLPNAMLDIAARLWDQHIPAKVVLPYPYKDLAECPAAKRAGLLGL